jgi:hypothetical protein
VFATRALCHAPIPLNFGPRVLVKRERLASDVRCLCLDDEGLLADLRERAEHLLWLCYRLPRAGIAVGGAHAYLGRLPLKGDCEVGDDAGAFGDRCG